MYKQAILTDPQTSGGLLISVSDEGLNEVMKIFEDEGLNRFITPIGRMTDDVEKVKISVLN
jgi:selenide,water dikinase